ncbi:MAG: prohibitin family protein [bacterium]|nr:prohibitin family protein [bacterium]
MPSQKVPAIAVILIAIGFLALSGLRSIGAGDVGVQFSRMSGVLPEELDEGWHWVIPGLVQITHYSIRSQTYTMSATIGEGVVRDADTLWVPTTEGLKVGMDLTVRYRLKPETVDQVHQKLGPDFAEKILRPSIRATLRLIVSEYGIMDVYGPKREEIQQKAETKLRERLAKDGIEIESIMLRDVFFTPEYQKSIENKQIAQQQAQQMEFVLEKEQKEAERKKIEAEGVKNATIIKAEGQAHAMEEINRMLSKNENLLQYMYIDKLADDVEVLIVPSGTGTLINPEALLKRR